CRGDSHPDSLKLVVLENNKKMFVKGLRTNEMDKTIAEYQKKEYSGFGIIDEENISKKLRDEMFVKWYQFSHENEMYSQVKASEYFLSLKRKEANFINPLEEWQGEYIFKYGRTDSYQSLSAKERFLIDTEGSSKVIAIKKLFIVETSETITSIDTLKLKITKATKDSLILKREKDFIYKISKDVDGNYKIGGRHVYMLSPPNNNYLLTKK
ncbi:hypothetical protein G1K94_12835, partial [Tenacibaculum finnmarkense]|uniref:hypothetical protein n=1 Tax=Tenacibaculum finnmarkense TaxID=2781243 RepID=UPI001EFAF1C6